MSSFDQYLTDRGKSIKRLIPIIAFGVLVLTLILLFTPFISVPDNNMKLISQIIDTFGWVIIGGFGFTAVEKFSKRATLDSGCGGVSDTGVVSTDVEIPVK